MLDDREFNRTLSKVSGWYEDFRMTDYFKGLNYVEKKWSKEIIMDFADLMYTYHDKTPGKWNKRAVRECCLETIPEKITSDKSFFESIAPVLSAFFRYLGDRKLLKNATKLAECVEKIGEKIVENAANPENWGIAKSFVMLALDSRVDVTDISEINEFFNKILGRDEVENEDIKDEVENDFEDDIKIPHRYKRYFRQKRTYTKPLTDFIDDGE